MFGLLSLVSTAAMLLSHTVMADTDIQFYWNAGCAGGGNNVAWTVWNAQANTCYYAGDQPWSIWFLDVPAGAKGQGYSNSLVMQQCTSYAGEVGSGYTCLTGGGPYVNANWFYPYKKLVRKDEIDAASLKPTRFSVRYELPDSTTREVEVTETELQKAVKAKADKNYEALAKFPVVSSSFPVKSKLIMIITNIFSVVYQVSRYML